MLYICMCIYIYMCVYVCLYIHMCVVCLVSSVVDFTVLVLNTRCASRRR